MHVTHFKQWALCALLFALFAGTGAFAQLSTATLSGLITDPTGAAVRNAKIVLTQTETNFVRESVTKSDGTYHEEFLPVGPYKLTVSAPGFKTLDRSGIVLAVMQSATMNLTLELGASTETISVTADVPLVNLSDSILGDTVDNKQVDNLPLIDRTVDRLLQLVPGVQSYQVINNLGYNEIKVLANGSTDGFVGQVSYYLDGGLNMTGLRNSGNTFPNPDAVSQFNVQTNDYSAQLGRYSAAVVSVVTKSGTNSIHGSLFEFFRDRNFNSTGFNSGGARPTPYNKNFFGATVGGPIRRDKDFFFGSYGGMRYRTAAGYSGALPSAAQIQGNFSENTPTSAEQANCSTTPSSAANTNIHFLVCNPATNTPYANNTLPAVDPTAVNILNYLVKNLPAKQPAQYGDNQYTYRTLSPTPSDDDEYLIKTDHQLTSAHHVTLSYFRLNFDNTPSLGGLTQIWSSSLYKNVQQNANASDVWTLGPRSVNQVWVAYTRQDGGRNATPATTLADFGSDLGVVGTPSRSNIGVGGVEGFTLAQAITGPKAGSNVYNVRNIFTTTRGRHSINVGGEAGLEKDFQLTSLNNYGTFSFASAQGKSAARTTNALSDFLAGTPSGFGQDTGLYANANYFNYGAFAQDDWKLLRNLTINIGLRYDWQMAPTDPQHMQTNFRPGVQSHAFTSTIIGGTGATASLAPLGMLFPGDPGVPVGGAWAPDNHFSPRLGFAYDPFNDGKTVIHGGAGVFFGGISGNEWEFPSNYAPYAVRNSGYQKVVSLTHPYTGDPTEFPGGVNPYPSLAFNFQKKTASFLPLNQVVAFDPNYRWPYSYQINFGVQRQLTRSLALSTTYVASLNRKTPLYNDINGPVFNVTSAGVGGASCTDLTQNCGYANTSSTINNRRPLNQSPYNPTLTPGTNNAAGASIPIYSNVWIIKSNQDSNYNGLQVVIDQRLTHHVSAKGYYTFSKTLQSNTLDSTSGLNGTFVDANYPQLEYHQRSDQDRRHMMTMNFVWTPDYFDRYNRAVRTALNGWTISGIWTANSGQPFTVTTGSDNYFSGNGNNRPSIIPGKHPRTLNPRSRVAAMQDWFDTTVYCRPGTDAGCAGVGPGGMLGNERPAILDDPGYRNVDARIARDFKFYERMTFKFRGEATNVFNLVNLGGPSSSMSSSTYGKITGSGGSQRVIQVGGSITF